MKRYLYCCLILICISLLSSAASAEGLTRISERVYSYVDAKNPSVANSFGSNAGIVIGDKGILVVDTLASAKEAQRFISDIRKVSDKPIRYVVLTHNHFDHTFGNSEFAALGAVILAQDNCTENMNRTFPEFLKNAKNYGMSDEEAKAIRLTSPNLTFATSKRIDMGGVNVDLLFISPSHTNDSIMVSIPEEKVVFTGDILFTDYYPYMGQGDIPGWTRNLDHILNMGIDQIIPGHGPVSTKKDVADMRNYLLAFDKAAKEWCAKSDDLKVIAAEVKKAVPARSRAEFLIMGSIQEKYCTGKK